MISHNKRVWWCLAALLALALPAGAQSSLAPASPSAEGSTGRFVFGPLSLQPRIAVSNVGIDSNVFNDAVNPVRDFTATVLPGVDTRLRMGRTYLTSRTTFEMLYFKRAKEQRAFNVGEELRFVAALARVRPFVFGGRVNSNQRPNSEVDQRVQQTTTTAGAGTEVLAGSRLRLAVSAEHRKSEFGDGLSDVAIANALSRRSTAVSGSMAIDVTPLTAVVVRSEYETERFEHASERDSHSTTISSGLEMKPFALISGTASLGYRRIAFTSAGTVPDFSGLVAAVSLNYLTRETTQLSVTAGRTPEFSIDPTEPYYVRSTGGVTLTQGIGGKWDTQLRANRELLAYRRTLVLEDANVTGRKDRLFQYGTGIGYRLQPGTRIGFDVNYVKRLSALEERRYDGYRVGGTVSYDY